MRLARIKLQGATAVYHCISRVVGGQFLLGDVEKEKLVQMLDPLTDFCGVQVITYCMMSNHFHLLLRVPARVELTDAQILDRMTNFYGSEAPLTVLARNNLEQHGKMDRDLQQTIQSRMYDLSAFMKEFKQGFSERNVWTVPEPIRSPAQDRCAADPRSAVAEDQCTARSAS